MATQLEMTFEQLLVGALQLPVQRRVELGEALFDSVDEEDPTALEAVWEEEIKHRVDAIDSGEAELIPVDVVFARTRARLKQISDAQAHPQSEMAFEQLLAWALQLPIQQRIELGEALFASVDSEDEDEDPAEVEAAWAEEIKRRVDEIRNGTVETYDAEEVMAELRARYG
jgi:putative addiction module component (TIGR02574 family)